MSCGKIHLHPVHLNRGRHGNAWICLACRKQLAGAKLGLNDDELDILAGYIDFLAQAGVTSRKARKEEKTMRLELSIMAGAESKAFLADLTKIVERMERATGSKVKASADTESDDVEVDAEEEDDFAPKKTKKAAAFDADEEEEAAEEESEDLAPTKKTKKAAAFDEEEEAEETPTKKSKKAAAFDADDEEEAEEEAEEEVKTKGKKSKKITQDDANDACIARVQRLIKKGQPGPEARKAVQKLLEKKFGTKSVTEVDPKDFGKVIEVMNA